MKVVVIGMIYRSTNYLKLMIDQYDRYSNYDCLEDDGFTTELLIIANDATNKVIDYLAHTNENYLIYKDPNPDEYYLNRVYRCWNFAGMNADADVIVFVNSDMVFSEEWLPNLLAQLRHDTIPVSRLVESGKMPSGLHALSQNFGREPYLFDQNNFNANENRHDWARFAELLMYTAPKDTEDGGLYMPVAFFKKDFVESGGFPEGNLYVGGVGRVDTPFLISGDKYFFERNHVMMHKKHITAMKSVVYHFQEGEMRE